MKLHERIRIQPMSTGHVAKIDERDMHIGMVDQAVREGHTHRARTHDQVIGLQRTHHHVALPPIPFTNLPNNSTRRMASEVGRVRHALVPRSIQLGVAFDLCGELVDGHGPSGGTR